jgi:hypothetical protein
MEYRPSRALRRSSQLLTIAFFVAGAGVFVVAIGVLLFVVPFSAPSNPGYGTYLFIRGAVVVFGILIILVAAGMALRALTWKTDNDLALVTGRFLEQYLNDRYTFIRNISKREIGYVDAVLVGPPGVLVFRILDTRGVFANEGPNWLKQNKRANGSRRASIRRVRRLPTSAKSVSIWRSMQGEIRSTESSSSRSKRRMHS